MGVLFLLFFVLVAHASSSAYNTQTPHDSRLLILFLDGLRWDYFNHLDATGGIGRMRTRGCHVPRVKPVFPANCYSNMHALFAGHNSTSLDIFNDMFEAEYTHPELLWNRALKLGKSVKLFHFPFCSSLLQRGMDCVQPVDKHTSLNTTLGDALQSLANHTTDLAVVYYGELDRVAHARGPSSEEMKHGETILKVDEAIFNVIQSLQILHDASLNFAVVSDHGMTDFKGFLALDRVFKWMLIDKVVNLGSAVGLWPKPDVEKNLADSLPADSHFHVYTPQTMPVTLWHPTRLPPIVLIADPGYIFQISYHPPVTWNHLSAHNISRQPQGVHGYLPDVTDMHTTFLAYGPAFEFGCGGEQGGLYTYDLFPLLNSALSGGAVIKPTTGGESETGWEMKLLGGILFTLFAVVLILGLALRRLLRIGRKHANSPLVYDFVEVDEYEGGFKADAEMKA
ncbi:Glycerophosphocholine cholinephosphodiesterase ENPP6 [Taenia solium]|eukprot:TsM_000604100 transcript=TsM_000604100 gene=TsM_000604100